MDIIRIICIWLGADIFGTVTIRPKSGDVLSFADGSGLCRIRGTIFCEGEYRDIMAVKAAAQGTLPAGVLRFNITSPVYAAERRNSGGAVFGMDFEAVYRGGTL